MRQAFGRTSTTSVHSAAAACAAAALLAVLLSGCVTQQGGTTGKLGRSVDQVVSSLASAELGLRQDQDGLTLPGASDTLLENMLEEVHTAAGDIGKLTPKTDADASRQRRALDMADAAEQALLSARANQQEQGLGGAPSTRADVRTLSQLATAFADETKGWAP